MIDMPQTEMCFVIAGLKGAWSTFHADANGLGTVASVDSQGGKKLWILAYRPKSLIEEDEIAELKGNQAKNMLSLSIGRIRCVAIVLEHRDVL